jgi:hypothetical protein
MKIQLALFICFLTLWPDALFAVENWQRLEISYVVVSNDLPRYRGQSLKLELYLCDENRNQCLPIGKGDSATAPTNEKAFKLLTQAEVTWQGFQAALARLRTPADKARLLLDVRANGQKDAKLSFQLSMRFKDILDLAKVGGSYRYLSGASPQSGVAEAAFFEALITAPTKNERIAAPPTGGTRPPVQ